MADDTIRREAFQFALDIADLCGEVFGDDYADLVDQVVDAADKIAMWLEDRAVQLVLKVGPITEQS